MVTRKFLNILIITAMAVIITFTFISVTRTMRVIRQIEGKINSAYRTAASSLINTLFFTRESSLNGDEKKEVFAESTIIIEEISGILALDLPDVLRKHYPEIDRAMNRLEAGYAEYRANLTREQDFSTQEEWLDLLITRQRALADSLTVLTEALMPYMHRQEYFHRILYLFYIGGIVTIILLMVQQNRTIRHQRHHNKEVRDLTDRIIESQERERNRMALDLHDTVAQELSTLMLSIETMADGISGEISRHYSSELRKRIKKISKETKDILVHVREISYNLRPPGLRELGFEKAVYNLYDGFSARTGIDCYFDTDGLDACELEEKEKMNLYRTIQEGLNNIGKHAEASNVHLEMQYAFPCLRITLRDDGLGFRQNGVNGSSASHMGIRGMKERVQICGGTMDIESSKRKGTTIMITVPVKRSEQG